MEIEITVVPAVYDLFKLFYRLFYFSVYSTYAEISTWCGQSGLTRSAWRWPSWPLSLQALNASPCSPLFLETENTSPSFTLKGQWWYTLTTQEIEISTAGMTASVFANQRLSKCLPWFLLLHNQLLIINTINENQWRLDASVSDNQ